MKQARRNRRRCASIRLRHARATRPRVRACRK
jgi:hypothetical protein